MIVHAGLIAGRVDGRWLGVLIEGASGAGKSDLALRCLDHGFSLVADDRVLVWSLQGRLYGRAPDVLHGRLEVRGLGILDMGALRFSEVAMVVRLGSADRMPDPATQTILGVSLPLLAADPFENSAPAKLAHALQAFAATHKRRI